MISVVVPAFNEAEGIAALYQRVSASADAWSEDYELIVVDDGSADTTLSVCKSLASADRRVKVLNLSRNFGHQAALAAGLAYARGDIVAIIDADLQDPPEQLKRFVDKCKEGYDVVYAVRRKRKEGMFKRAAYHVYYRLLRRLAAIDMPLDAGDFCVMSRRVVDSINNFPERGRYLRGLRAWVGYRQTGLEYERATRAFGKPKYTIARLVGLGVDGIFNFSYKPLQIVMFSGGIIAVGTFVVAIGVFWQYVGDITILGYNPHQARGWTSLLLALLFLAGVELIAIGVLGEYVGRLFDEVKARPVFLVKEAVNFDGGVPDGIAPPRFGREGKAHLDATVQCIESLARRIAEEAIREIGRTR
jgi:glycosyltransferase involved in cell wall biosynthesis